MNFLSSIPSVDKLLETAEIKQYIPQLSRPLVKKIIQNYLEEIRNSGHVPCERDIIDTIRTLCINQQRKSFQTVINATGIVLHTNLGRSPLPDETWEKVRKLNTAYTNLEMDITTGKRGRRGGNVSELMNLALGSEDSLVLNNNAAAVYLILLGLAKGKEVIVSRGQQVQIGGGFRIPEILSFSRAIMKEVGTTNITSLSDYKNAITPQTAMILLVHTSNYTIQGFTKQVSIEELRQSIDPEILIVMDEGSGHIKEELPEGTKVGTLLDKGADLVSFSTDKIFGGPQGGVIAGKRELIEKLRRNPMARAFRAGKTILTLLEAILIEKLNENPITGVEHSLAQSASSLKTSAEKLRGMIGHSEKVHIVPSTWTLGGGSTPNQEYPSWSLRINSEQRAQKLANTLRLGTPCILGLINNDAVELNIATCKEDDFPVIAQAIRQYYENTEQQ